MKISEFDFNLPEELIAQVALPDRTASRLLVMDRATGQVEHSHVRDLGRFLRPGDLLVVNNSRVMPARLLGQAADGLEVECFLLKRLSKNSWESLVKPGKKLHAGALIICKRADATLIATLKSKSDDGKLILELSGDGKVDELLEEVGHVPLPPYIKRDDSQIDKSRYQTVYAKASGSVAAPTAGLHFTPELLDSLKKFGIDVAEVTLHVGYGTFKPVRVENVEEHEVDEEVYEISDESASKINAALQENRRVIAVGTTTTRALESAAQKGNGKIHPGADSTRLFIRLPFKFQVVSGLMTNFHLPKSSLLVMVSAFAGKDKVLAAYSQAIAQKYRFYSYGDAMLVLDR